MQKRGPRVSEGVDTPGQFISILELPRRNKRYRVLTQRGKDSAAQAALLKEEGEYWNIELETRPQLQKDNQKAQRR